MLHSCPTLVSKPFIPHLPIIYLLPLPSHHRPSLLAILLHLLPPLLPPDSLRVLQWNAGGLRARSTELLHFLSSHPVDLICIQEFNINSSLRIPGFSALRSDRTHSRSGILFSNTTHASGGVVIFVRQGLSFSELSTSSLSSLDPYFDYVAINISLNNSSSLSFLNVYAPLFAPLQRIAEPTPFLPPTFPRQEISSVLETLIAITPSGTQEVLPTPAGRKTLNAAKFFIPFGRIKRHPKAWWSAEVEGAVSERRKAFAAAHRSDEDQQAYISASRRASSVIAKAKTEAWQTTCSSLSPKSNPKSVHSLLRSIAGSPS